MNTLHYFNNCKFSLWAWPSYLQCNSLTPHIPFPPPPHTPSHFHSLIFCTVTSTLTWPCFTICHVKETFPAQCPHFYLNFCFLFEQTCQHIELRPSTTLTLVPSHWYPHTGNTTQRNLSTSHTYKQLNWHFNVTFQRLNSNILTYV